jgi:hypothetical protein
MNFPDCPFAKKLDDNSFLHGLYSIDFIADVKNDLIHPLAFGPIPGICTILAI